MIAMLDISVVAGETTSQGRELVWILCEGLLSCLVKRKQWVS